jgi:hypothetical protein
MRIVTNLPKEGYKSLFGNKKIYFLKQILLLFAKNDICSFTFFNTYTSATYLERKECISDYKSFYKVRVKFRYSLAGCDRSVARARHASVDSHSLLIHSLRVIGAKKRFALARSGLGKERSHGRSEREERSHGRRLGKERSQSCLPVVIKCDRTSKLRRVPDSAKLWNGSSYRKQEWKSGKK